MKKAAWSCCFPAPTTKTNPHLDPEEIETYEAVWEQTFLKKMHSVVSVFYYEIDNLIGQVTDPADDLLVFQNQDRTTAHGFELELEGRWRKIDGRVSYTYQKTKDEHTGATLSNSPENLFKLNLNVPLWAAKASAGLEVQYVSDRQTLDGVPIEDFTVTNLTLLSNALDNLAITASVFNLFDKGYKDPGAAEHDYQPEGIEQDGRTFWFKFTYGF